MSKIDDQIHDEYIRLWFEVTLLLIPIAGIIYAIYC